MMSPPKGSKEKDDGPPEHCEAGNSVGKPQLRTATCSWCGKLSVHLQVAEGSFIRGARFICGACGKHTGLCARFSTCQGAAKAASPIFDPLCAACIKGIARSIPGNDLLEKLSSNASPLGALSKEQAEKAASYLKGKGEELGRTLVGGTQDLKANLFSGMTAKREEESDSLVGSSGSTTLGAGSSTSCDVVPRSASEQHTRAGHSEAASRGLCGEEEPWEAVRDALLTWEGPERAHVDVWRAHLSRKGFVTRWLTSSKGDANLAAERLMKHLKWRCDWGLHRMGDEDWACEDAKGEMYVAGVDREGRAAMTWRLGLFRPKDRTPYEHVRYLVCNMERTWDVTPFADHMNVIVDCRGIGLETYHHETVALAIQILSQNYPDNLKVVIVFPVGWVLTSLLALFTPLLSKETASKGRLLQEGQENAGLSAYFDVSQIEERLGGGLDPRSSRLRRYAQESEEQRKLMRASQLYAATTDLQASDTAKSIQKSLGMTPTTTAWIEGTPGGKGRDEQPSGVDGSYLTEGTPKDAQTPHKAPIVGVWGMVCAVGLSSAVWWVIFIKRSAFGGVESGS